MGVCACGVDHVTAAHVMYMCMQFSPVSFRLPLSRENVGIYSPHDGTLQCSWIYTSDHPPHGHIRVL